MGAVVHEDGEAQLARADDTDRKQIGQRIWPPRDQRDGTDDQGPGVHDHRDALPCVPLAHGDQFILAEKIAGAHAEHGHDQISPSGELGAAATSPPTTRSFALTDADPGSLACWPTTRSISRVKSSGERPIA